MPLNLHWLLALPISESPICGICISKPPSMTFLTYVYCELFAIGFIVFLTIYIILKLQAYFGKYERSKMS